MNQTIEKPIEIGTPEERLGIAINFQNTPKPKGIRPLDVALTTHFILQGDFEKEDWPSYQQLAECYGCTAETIREAIERAEDIGWITRIHRTGKSYAICVNLHKLPKKAFAAAAVVTKDAIEIGQRYMDWLCKAYLVERGKKKKLNKKRFLAQQSRSAQWMLNHLGGNKDLVLKIINFAIRHPEFKKRARNSLFKLRQCWFNLTLAYEQAKEEEAKNAAAVPVVIHQAEPGPDPKRAELVSKIESLRRTLLGPAKHSKAIAEMHGQAVQALSDYDNQRVKEHT